MTEPWDYTGIWDGDVWLGSGEFGRLGTKNKRERDRVLIVSENRLEDGRLDVTKPKYNEYGEFFVPTLSFEYKLKSDGEEINLTLEKFRRWQFDFCMLLREAGARKNYRMVRTDLSFLNCKRKAAFLAYAEIGFFGYR
jgi:hypothetical protein